MPDVQLFGGTGIEDVRTTFARTTIDLVIMGAGLELSALPFDDAGAACFGQPVARRR
jgi:hypothetical protein